MLAAAQPAGPGEPRRRSPAARTHRRRQRGRRRRRRSARAPAGRPRPCYASPAPGPSSTLRLSVSAAPARPPSASASARLASTIGAQWLRSGAFEDLERRIEVAGVEGDVGGPQLDAEHLRPAVGEPFGELDPVPLLGLVAAQPMDGPDASEAGGEERDRWPALGDPGLAHARARGGSRRPTRRGSRAAAAPSRDPRCAARSGAISTACTSAHRTASPSSPAWRSDSTSMWSASLRSKPTNPGEGTDRAEGLDPLATVRDRVVEPALVPSAGRGGIERAGEDHRIADGAGEGKRLVGRSRHRARSRTCATRSRRRRGKGAPARRDRGSCPMLSARRAKGSRRRPGPRRRSRPSASLPRSPARRPQAAARRSPAALGGLARLPEEPAAWSPRIRRERRPRRPRPGPRPAPRRRGRAGRLLVELLRAGGGAAARGQLGGLDRRLVRRGASSGGRREARRLGEVVGDQLGPLGDGARGRGRGPDGALVQPRALGLGQGASRRRRGSAGGGRRSGPPPTRRSSIRARRRERPERGRSGRCRAGRRAGPGRRCGRAQRRAGASASPRPGADRSARRSPPARCRGASSAAASPRRSPIRRETSSVKNGLPPAASAIRAASARIVGQEQLGQVASPRRRRAAAARAGCCCAPARPNSGRRSASSGRLVQRTRIGAVVQAEGDVLEQLEGALVGPVGVVHADRQRPVAREQRDEPAPGAAAAPPRRRSRGLPRMAMVRPAASEGASSAPSSDSSPCRERSTLVRRRVRREARGVPQDLAERPEGDALAVGRAPADDRPPGVRDPSAAP